MTSFSIDGKPVADSYICPNIFAFCAFMAAAVAKRRGGKPHHYIRECYDFEKEVIGKALSVTDPLPADFDWRVSAAVECADAMMEYDSD